MSPSIWNETFEKSSFKSKVETEEMALWFQVLAALVEDLSLFFQYLHSFSQSLVTLFPGRSDTFFWPLGTTNIHGTGTHTHKINIR